MPQTIEFGWDSVKAASNLAKHKVSFEDAMTVLHDHLRFLDRTATLQKSRNDGLRSELTKTAD